MKLTLGQISVDAVSISIASLVKGALSAMIVEKVKWAGIAVFAMGVTLVGAAVMARQPGGAVAARQPGAPTRSKSPARNPALVDNRLDVVDSGSTDQPDEGARTPGTPTPELDDLRSRLIQAAKHDWTAALADFRANKAPLDRIYEASLRLMAAEEDGKSSLAGQAAASAHADRMRDVARIQHGNPSRSESQVSLVDAYSAEAELWRGAGGRQIPLNGEISDRKASRGDNAREQRKCCRRRRILIQVHATARTGPAIAADHRQARGAGHHEVH